MEREGEREREREGVREGERRETEEEIEKGRGRVMLTNTLSVLSSSGTSWAPEGAEGTGNSRMMVSASLSVSWKETTNIKYFFSTSLFQL